MINTEVKTVGVIGGGLIGDSWAALFAANKLNVRVFDPSEAVRDRVVSRAIEKMGDIVEDANSLRDQITVCDDLEKALKGVDFVQENAPENEALKQKLFKDLESLAPTHAIFASSTSSLTWNDFTSEMQDPSRAIAAHPFNPPHLLPLVEIYGSNDQIVESAFKFYRGLGRTPIRIRKPVAGHIANRLTAALFREAVNIVDSKIGTAEDVDTALKSGPGLRWSAIGVFLGYHLGGGDGGIRNYLSHFGPSQEKRWAHLGNPELTPEVCEEIARQVEGVADRFAPNELERTLTQFILKNQIS